MRRVDSIFGTATPTALHLPIRNVRVKGDWPFEFESFMGVFLLVFFRNTIHISLYFHVIDGRVARHGPAHLNWKMCKK